MLGPLLCTLPPQSDLGLLLGRFCAMSASSSVVHGTSVALSCARSIGARGARPCLAPPWASPVQAARRAAPCPCAPAPTWRASRRHGDMPPRTRAGSRARAPPLSETGPAPSSPPRPPCPWLAPPPAGAVAQLLGPSRWPELRAAFAELRGSRDPDVLCEVVAAVPVVARLVGPAVTQVRGAIEGGGRAPGGEAGKGRGGARVCRAQGTARGHSTRRAKQSRLPARLLRPPPFNAFHGPAAPRRAD